MSGLLLLAMAIMLLVILCIVIRSKSQVGEGARAFVHSPDHGPYVRGYMQALLDIDRTGLRPITDESRRNAAQRSYERVYIERR